MSVLAPHIRAARAYEAAYREAWGSIADQRLMIEYSNMARIHGRAAEIMAAEQAADYRDGGYPLQREV